jgi:glycosyltransferase involved in cell wall biosynthesis
VRSTAWGGAERHTVAVARSVAAKGHDVLIVQLGHDLFPRHAGLDSSIATVSVAPGRSFSVMGWRHLLRRHRIQRAVLVKGIFGVRWTPLDLAVLMARTPMITIEHQYADENAIRTVRGGLGVWRGKEHATLALHRRAARRVVAVSHAIADRLIASYGFDPARVTVIANGVDHARFVPESGRRARARARWRVPDDSLVFGFLGRMSTEKRIDRLLEAFRRMRDSVPGNKPSVVLVGSGPAEPNLRRHAEELGIADACRWTGMTTTPWEEYPGFDAFVLSSDREGLPYTVLEAMSCGLPVIAVDIPGTRQMVMEGETGIITARSPESLAQAMLAIASSAPAVREAWGARARERILAHHDGQKAADAVADIAIAG